MRRNRCSSRAFFGRLTNEESGSDEDADASSSRSEGPGADDEEEDENEDEDEDDEDEDPESGDEYKDTYVNHVFRKEYQEAREGSAQGLLRGTRPATPDSDFGVRSSGRTKRAVNYKERQLKDIPFRPVWEAPKVCCATASSH